MENLLLQTLPKDKLDQISKIKNNKDFCLKVIKMVKQTYDCVVSESRSGDNVEFALGKRGDYDMYGGQIYSVFITAKERGVFITSFAAFAFKKDYNRICF